MTDFDLIDALGGPATLGRLLGVTGPAVSNWRLRGIPARWHFRLWQICQERKIDWHPDKEAA